MGEQGRRLGERERTYATVWLSLLNGALNCSIVGLACPLPPPFDCGPAGLAALLELLLKCLDPCLAAVPTRADRRLVVFILIDLRRVGPQCVVWRVVVGGGVKDGLREADTEG